MLLDDMVVSIEPATHTSGRRKRDRSDEGSSYRPAYFNIEQRVDNNQSDINPSSKDESDTNSKEINREKINNDPAICSFQAAIVKRSRTGSGFDREKESGMATPIKTHRMDIDSEDETRELYDPNSNVLLFRFGNYFLFEVNPTAIVKVEHRSDEMTGEQGKDNKLPQDDDVHPSKKQRTEDDKNSTSTHERRPASLIIYFPSCAFRVFSLDKMSDHVFVNAESKILQQFDIGCSISTWVSTSIGSTESELWQACLHSRKEKISPTKADSSSTIEHGQQQFSGIRMNETSKSDDAHEDKVDHSQSQSTVVNGTTKTSELQSGEEAISEDSTWLREISTRRRAFDFSWSFVDKSVSTNGKSSTLSASAHSLDRSYINLKQYTTFAEQCDAKIDNVTKQVQETIEAMMPMRGRRSNSTDPGPSNEVGNNDQSITRLLGLRKQAIAAKYALLLIPKK